MFSAIGWFYYWLIVFGDFSGWTRFELLADDKRCGRTVIITVRPKLCAVFKRTVRNLYDQFRTSVSTRIQEFYWCDLVGHRKLFLMLVLISSYFTNPPIIRKIFKKNRIFTVIKTCSPSFVFWLRNEFITFEACTETKFYFVLNVEQKKLYTFTFGLNQINFKRTAINRANTSRIQSIKG